MPKESPDGMFIYYQTGWPTQCSVWKMQVGGGEETMVLDAVHPAGLQYLSPSVPQLLLPLLLLSIRVYNPFNFPRLTNQSRTTDHRGEKTPMIGLTSDCHKISQRIGTCGLGFVGRSQDTRLATQLGSHRP